MPIVISDSNFSNESIIFNRIPEIKRTQQVLMLVISIVFSICIISFLTTIYSLSINYRTNTYEPIIFLLWILFFALGMFVTQRYYPIGLFIFAWLGIINIILTCILTILVTVAIVILTSETSEQKSGVPFNVIPIVICLTSVILDAVIVIFSFKLSYLIMKNKNSRNHQRI